MKLEINLHQLQLLLAWIVHIVVTHIGKLCCKNYVNHNLQRCSKRPCRVATYLVVNWHCQAYNYVTVSYARAYIILQMLHRYLFTLINKPN